MKRDLRRTFLMPALLALLAFVAAPLFGATALAADATLYELTENMKLVGKDKDHPRRKATSELMGFAAKGSPLCPTALLDQLAAKHFIDPTTFTQCTINATGSDNISLATGLGKFGGTFTVVIQDDNAVDSPEFVVAKGKFSGKMDFSLAILYKLPLGHVVGHMELDHFGGTFPFTGTFRLPFVVPGYPPLYLWDDYKNVFPVEANEYSLGYPTVRFEINF